ncbi:hypothetical protein MKEN_01096800 [Mycena kentingensis (nom. inval.)]|nr:hypothetical protein MKEN_01096800 [Mycena kentingensis (nom. inval.)]
MASSSVVPATSSSSPPPQAPPKQQPWQHQPVYPPQYRDQYPRNGSNPINSPTYMSRPHLYPSPPPGPTPPSYSDPSPMYAPMTTMHQGHREPSHREKERDRDRERERERREHRDREREREREPSRDFPPHSSHPSLSWQQHAPVPPPPPQQQQPPPPPQPSMPRTFQGQFHTSFVQANTREGSPPGRRQRSRPTEREVWGVSGSSSTAHAPPPPPPPQDAPLDWEVAPTNPSNIIAAPVVPSVPAAPATPPDPPERVFKARRTITIGSFVYPHTPFPYTFPLEPLAEDTKAEETVDSDPEIVTLETRATLLIPSAYLPLSKPTRPPRVWGGAVPSSIDQPYVQRDERPSTRWKPLEYDPKQRRIYTDDSDPVAAAVHAGYVRWSSLARARREGRDMRVEVRMVRVLGVGADALVAVPAAEEPKEVLVDEKPKDKDVKEPAKAKSPPPPPMTEAVGRFAGGWGARCGRAWEDMDKPGSGSPTQKEKERDDPRDDGRRILSAGWGAGHAGSAFEVLDVVLVERRAAHGPARQNRTQRFAEYATRRAALGLSTPSTATSRIDDVLPPCPGPAALCPHTRPLKRRRATLSEGPSSPPTNKRMGSNASVLDAIIEEAEAEESAKEAQRLAKLGHGSCACVELERVDRKTMEGRTVICAFGGGNGLGFKYEPDSLRQVMFPPVEDDEPPRKRRKVQNGDEHPKAAVNGVGSEEGETMEVDIDAAPKQDALAAAADTDTKTKPKEHSKLRAVYLQTTEGTRIFSPCTSPPAPGTDKDVASGDLRWDVSRPGDNSDSTPALVYRGLGKTTLEFGQAGMRVRAVPAAPAAPVPAPVEEEEAEEGEVREEAPASVVKQEQRPEMDVDESAAWREAVGVTVWRFASGEGVKS